MNFSSLGLLFSGRKTKGESRSQNIVGLQKGQTKMWDNESNWMKLSFILYLFLVEGLDGYPEFYQLEILFYGRKTKRERVQIT